MWPEHNRPRGEEVNTCKEIMIISGRVKKGAKYGEKLQRLGGGKQCQHSEPNTRKQQNITGKLSQRTSLRTGTHVQDIKKVRECSRRSFPSRLQQTILSRENVVSV